MIEDRKIKELLDKFYDGNTTPEEERIILEYLKNEDIEEGRVGDRELFAALYDSSEIHPPEGLSERLERRIDEHISNSAKKGNSARSQKASRTKIRKLYLSIGSVAAAALLCVSIFFVLQKPSSPIFMANTDMNETEAAAIAVEALIQVSSKLNEGLSSLEKVSESIDKTNELINKNLKINQETKTR
jgi:hypothetical protein